MIQTTVYRRIWVCHVICIFYHQRSMFSQNNQTLCKAPCRLIQFEMFDFFQFCRSMALSNNDSVDWKLMYFTLQKHYPKKEEYGDTLHYCKHCSSLFWKVTKLTITTNTPLHTSKNQNSITIDII